MAFVAIAFLGLPVQAIDSVQNSTATVTQTIVVHDDTDQEYQVKRGATVTIALCLEEGVRCLVGVEDRKIIVPGDALELEDGRTALQFETERWAASRAKSAARINSYRINDIAVWGDSLTRGSGSSPGKSYPEQMEANTIKRVENYGMSGESVRAISQRFFQTDEKHNMITVFWAGRNDVAGDVAPAFVSNQINEMVKALPHDMYLVLSVTNGSNEPQGSDAYTKIMAINLALSERFGDRFLDVQRLINNSALPDEMDARRMDMPPPSKLSDAIHFNDEGYGIVAKAVLDKIREFGW